MKKCPYCAEEIQDEAKVCRYCNRELEAAPPAPAVTEPLPDAKTSGKAVVSLILSFSRGFSFPA